MQAGREVRVVVDAKAVADDAAAVLARDIAKAVEGQLTYPGEIKVTVVRETRAVSFAPLSGLSGEAGPGNRAKAIASQTLTAPSRGGGAPAPGRGRGVRPRIPRNRPPSGSIHGEGCRSSTRPRGRTGA